MSTKIREMVETAQAEEATGITESRGGLGKYYTHGGSEWTVEEAKERFHNQEAIEVPNAGAGSYHKFLASMGAKKVEVWDHTSSAGDWYFMVEFEDGWYLVSQGNRHPRCGFSYSKDRFGFETKDDLIEYLKNA